MWGGATLALVGVLLALGLYAMTRPPELDKGKWPAFQATLAGSREGEPFDRQVWWRKSTWCGRLIGGDTAWTTTYGGAAVRVSTLEDGKILEVIRAAADGPIDGFGPKRVDEAAKLVRDGGADVTRGPKIAGRRTWQVTSHREPGGIGKTWWIDARTGISLGYREADLAATYVDWRVTKLRLVDAAPWNAKGVKVLDELLKGPFGLISVRQTEDLSANDQIVPDEQKPDYIDQTQRVFTRCRPGATETVPLPSLPPEEPALVPLFQPTPEPAP